MKIFALALTLTLATLLTTSCATILSGSDQIIQVSSMERGTEIYVNERYVGKDNIVIILRSSNNYQLRGSKEGCENSIDYVNKELAPTTLLNIFFWPGFIIDGVTGSWYQFERNYYSVTPKCS